MSLLLPDDVAAHLGVTREFVMTNCRTGRWPHIKVGKHYRFSPLQLAAIEELCTVTPAAPDTTTGSWGVVTRNRT